MAPITSLAEETLQLLFAHINSTKHLAQCRLVCKRFDPIAEKAMFNCPVAVHTENQAFSLLKHLVRCQRKGIAYFHWGLETTILRTPQVFRHLLPFILTSKTVSLSGCVEESEFYDLIDEIVQQLPEKPKLISLPHPVVFGEPYYRFLIKYQNTLQSAHVHLMGGDTTDEDYIVDVLDMPTLKSLVIKGDTIDMINFIPFLDEQLEELEMEFAEIDRTWDSREEIQTWLRLEPVHPNDNMKKLTLKGDCPACQIECLMYLFPKLESVTIDLRYPGWETYNGLQAQMNRILDCLGDVAQKELAITSYDGQFLKETIAYLKNDGLDIKTASVKNEFDIRVIVCGLD